VSFLRRLLGGGSNTTETEPTAADAPPTPALDPEEAERRHELELLREEAARMDDLRQRQQRYAHLSWTPPPQGGSRRADDEEAAEEDAPV